MSNFFDAELANVLFIDDSEAEMVLSKATLSRDHVHMNFLGIHGGQDALDFLDHKAPYETAVQPDLIFLDLNMPDMDGKEILRHIKQTPVLQHIPVIIYSGSEARRDFAETKALGASHYMVKTINYQKLVDALTHIHIVTFFEHAPNHYLLRNTDV